jgi:hypothetical protein
MSEKVCKGKQINVSSGTNLNKKGLKLLTT